MRHDHSRRWGATSSNMAPETRLVRLSTGWAQYPPELTPQTWRGRSARLLAQEPEARLHVPVEEPGRGAAAAEAGEVEGHGVVAGGPEGASIRPRRWK